MRKILYSFLLLLLTGCSSSPPAPVVDQLPSSKKSTVNANTATKKTNAKKPSYQAGDWRPESYVVKKGDTLFSIGLEYGYDYKDIAQVNKISAPYTINVGQTLKFTASKEKPATTINSDGVEITPINTDSNSNEKISNKATNIMALSEPKAIREPYTDEAYKKPLPTLKPADKALEKPLEKTTEKQATINSAKPASTATNTAKPSAENKPANDVSKAANDANKPETDLNEEIDWTWPTKGKVTAQFNEANNKGINIAGNLGQEITAAAAGKVIYNGSDLRGYGKLVIIKHNANYLSVYAHNSLITVKEGQQVSRGQKIAEMGNTDSNSVMLHFEIRRQGKSVDPSKYLVSN